MKKDLRTVLFLLITTSACTLLLVGANAAYQRAASIFSVRLYAEILDLFRIETGEGDIEETFAEHFTIETIGGTTYYTSKTKRPGTVAFVAEGAGLWSRIETLIAVNPKGESLYGLRILAQAETPGLGGRIAEKEFQNSFHDAAIRPHIDLVKFAIADNEIDAISGATRTSNALEDIINKGVARMDQALGREE